MSEYVITIARGFGSGGKTIGQMLAKKLDIDYFDNDLLRLASEESGINIALFGKADEKVKANLFKKYNRSYGQKVISPDSTEFISDDNLFNYQAKIIRELAEKQNCILIGRCADHILKDNPKVIRIFVCADPQACIDKVVELYGIDADDAKKKIEKIDKSRAAYYKYYTGKEWNDPVNYDLCINTTSVGFDGAVDIITDYMARKGIKIN